MPYALRDFVRWLSNQKGCRRRLSQTAPTSTRRGRTRTSRARCAKCKCRPLSLDRATLDHFRDRGPVRVVQPRGLSGRLAADQTIRPIDVELHYQVPDGLQRHALDPGSIGGRRTVMDRRKRQKPPRTADAQRVALKHHRRGASPRRDKRNVDAADEVLSRGRRIRSDKGWTAVVLPKRVETASEVRPDT